MNRKMVDSIGNNNSIRFNPTKKLSPQEVARPYEFIVKEEIGTGFREILFGHNLRTYKTLDESSRKLKEKMIELEKISGIDDKKHQLIVISVDNRNQLAIEGIAQKQITDWVKKLNIPEK